MKKTKQIKGKLSLVFVTAILILCAGFLIVGCGTDPVLKVKDLNKGAYAVDFNACTGNSSDYCYGSAGDADNPMVDISDKEITFEAMIKASASSGVTGGVFSRLDSATGAVLYVKGNEPRFAMRVGWIGADPNATSTAAYTVESGVSLVQDAWTHIAGVIANADHSAVHADCPDGEANPTGGSAETPHLDIYVDGTFKNCATTWGYSEGAVSDPATGPQYADNPGSSKIFFGKIEHSVAAIDTDITNTKNLNAVVDELRLWTTARTADQISACNDKELGLGGTCYRGDPNLAVYYRLNEGTAKLATDFSGNGYVGSFFYSDSDGDEHEWEAVWVAGDGLTGAD